MRKRFTTIAGVIGGVVCTTALLMYIWRQTRKYSCEEELQQRNKYYLSTEENTETEIRKELEQERNEEQYEEEEEEEISFAAVKDSVENVKEIANREPEKKEMLSEDDLRQGMELLKRLKEKSNVAFQEGKFEDAIQGYEYCVNIIAAMGNSTPELVSTAQVIRANVVMVLLKLAQFESAAMVASMLLQDTEHPLPNDLLVKVLYRRGLASKNLGNKDAALADFNAAVELSPFHKNAAATREITLLKKKQKHMITVNIFCNDLETQ